MNKPGHINRLGKNYPELGTDPISLDYFTPEYFQLEKERVFKKCWLMIGRVEETPNVGDYRVVEVEVGETSLIVTHAADGKIRAFHNMCSHRSNRVAYEEKGNTKTFKCRFHAWTYGLDGALIHLPEPDLFPDFDPCDHGLTEVACDVWEGFIFINLDPEPEETLEEYLGEEIWGQFNGFFDQYTEIATLRVNVKTNWKICLDAFVETYHFSTVHALSAKQIITSDENPEGLLEAARLYKRHRAVSVKTNPAHEPTPTEMIVGKFGGHATIAPDSTSADEKGHPPGINPEKLDGWGSDIIVLFPFSDVQPFDGWFVSQNFWPISHEETRWEFHTYMRKPTNAGEELACEYNRAFMRDALREDLNNLEMIQSTLGSGAKTTQQLGDQEIVVRHGYKVMADHVGS